jgi:cell wall-associated NlpC family hydrolase
VRHAPLLLLLLLLGACATQRSTEPSSVGERIASHALAELGSRYRYGGDDARGGFDCSGLTRAVHAREGLEIPRTAAAQFSGGRRIATNSLRPGDLVFFRFGAAAVDHVGVYIGAGEFVHAPRAGDKVRRVDMTAPWFAQRYAGAARYWRD